MMIFEMQKLLWAMRRAGRAVRRCLGGDLGAQRKANGDLITKVDIEVNQILQESLLNTFTEDGWLSEETNSCSERLTKRRVWVVDPIDGTKELAYGIPEFAISVALVEDGSPALAAVYNPVPGEMFTASRGGGAYFNVRSRQCQRPPGDRLVILASRSEVEAGKFEAFKSLAEVRPIGSIAYKLALIARGDGDGTFSLDPKNEWDIAAGVLLVAECGGRATHRNGAAFTFNQPNTLVDGIVAARSGAYDRVQELIRQVSGSHAGLSPIP